MCQCSNLEAERADKTEKHVQLRTECTVRGKEKIKVNSEGSTCGNKCDLEQREGNSLVLH